MAIVNGSFETQDVVPEQALSWDAEFVSSLEEWADFDLGGGATSSQEGMEHGWTAGVQEFVGAFVGETIDVEAAIFNVGPGQRPVERFELAWGTPGMWLEVLPAAVSATFSALAEERFESGWGIVELVLPDSAVPADFTIGVPSAEEFDWNLLTAGSFASAYFTEEAFPDPAFESFEESGIELTCTADATENTIDASAAEVPFFVGERVHFTNDGGALPAPLAEGTYYFVVGIEEEVLQVAATQGGAPIDLSDAGTGTQAMIRGLWSRFMSTV